MSSDASSVITSVASLGSTRTISDDFDGYWTINVPFEHNKNELLNEVLKSRREKLEDAQKAAFEVGMKAAQEVMDKYYIEKYIERYVFPVYLEKEKEQRPLTEVIHDDTNECKSKKSTKTRAWFSLACVTPLVNE
jgi:hypothetical protein